MTRLRRVVPLLFLVAAVSSGASGAESPRELVEQMIALDVVLAHADDVGLDARQRESIHRLLSEHHAKMPALLQQMREERDALLALLKLDKPEEAAVLAQFDRLNAVETELKRRRFQMTVGAKKILTPAQQTKALALRDRRTTEGAAVAEGASLPAKLQRVKDGLEQWKREGRDVAPLRASWERFRAAEEKGHYRQARQALDEAIALLDTPPAAR